ncbi:MAG: universal stress protein [Pseudomonadota bacterium]
MTYKTILLHLSDDDAAETRRAHAAALARRFDAKLVGLALAAPAHPLTLASPEAMGEVWAEISAQSDERADALRTRFAEAMSAEGVRFEARAARAPGLAADAFALHARYADLSVLASPAAAGSPAEREERDQAIRGALFESGRPVLLLPETGLPDGRAREALIAWDGRKEAARALRDALPLLADVEGAEVCTVETLFDDGPDNDGASLAASEYLAAHGVPVDANTLNRSFGIASALSERARERGSDLLVMGGYGHSRLSEAIFGGVTETLLRESPIPIFMAH